MSIILIFIDGIGLGDNNPEINPFAVMNTPTLHDLSGGQRWLRDTPRTVTDRAIFMPTDAELGIEKGKPASGSGQAAILTGRNIPHEIGEHYGPKPNKAIRDILDRDNLFLTLKKAGRAAALINPHPPRLFEVIQSGRRLPSSIQYAVLAAGIALFNHDDYYQRRAMSPDWTGHGWVNHLGYHDAPIYEPEDAGKLLAEIGKQRDFSMFSTWLTDEFGHRARMAEAVEFMEVTDRVLAGLLANWRDADGLIVLTSDHGNMEAMDERTHTRNKVPTVAIGGGRETFADNFSDLTHITPGILRVLGVNSG